MPTGILSKEKGYAEAIPSSDERTGWTILVQVHHEHQGHNSSSQALKLAARQTGRKG
jgi:hypothetical protein